MAFSTAEIMEEFEETAGLGSVLRSREEWSGFHYANKELDSSVVQRVKRWRSQNKAAVRAYDRARYLRNRTNALLYQAEYHQEVVKPRRAAKRAAYVALHGVVAPRKPLHNKTPEESCRGMMALLGLGVPAAQVAKIFEVNPTCVFKVRKRLMGKW